MGNDVYNMISIHKGKYVVSSIWIYKNKYTKQGSWFASERIDYDMTYSIDQYISSIEPPVQNVDDTPLQGEWLQKISEFDMVRHDGELPDGSRLLGFQPSKLNAED